VKETTSTAMNWGMAFLLNNEKCMQKMRTEIGSVMDQNELMVTVDKRPKLPYTNAVIDV
jgi:cytochrome P450